MLSFVAFVKLRIRKLFSRDHYCAVCDGTRFVEGQFVFARRELVCTCGAGPLDELTLHDGTCDLVPCPFCQLLGQKLVVR